MITLDPATVLLINLLVGLMAMGLLLLSRTATAQVRQGMVAWVSGDAVASLARLVLLLQPGVLFSTGVQALQPNTAALLNAMLVIVGATTHTLGFRAVFKEQDNRRAWLAVPVVFCLTYLAGAQLLPNHEAQVMLELAITGSCMVWTLRLAWLHRQPYRGAWLVCGIMAVMLAFVVTTVARLAVTPPLQHGLPRLPPLGVLLLSLVSSLGLTMAFMLVQFERMNGHIQRLSVTDTLTGAYNRRGFLQQLGARWDEARRHGRPLALAILDLDHFKRINDTLGHDMGDAVLVGFVARLRANMRTSDVLGRWGGEEFVLLMPETSQEQALLVTDRLRLAVAAEPLVAGAPVVTLSGGVTGLLNLPAELKHEMLITQADARLYRAKRQRNCVVGSDAAGAVATRAGAAATSPA